MRVNARLMPIAVAIALNCAIAGAVARHAPQYLADWRQAHNPDAAHYVLLGKNFFDAFFFLNRAFYAIGVGAWLGTIMIFNVWVLIWPNQQKILGMVQATDEEKAKARRIAFLASRTNTMLSIPMLFFMAAAGHQGIFFG